MGLVTTTKFADPAPAGITTFAGTVATEVFELDRVIVAPAAGAFPVRETVAVDGSALMTDVGLTTMVLSVEGGTVRVCCTEPLYRRLRLGTELLFTSQD